MKTPPLLLLAVLLFWGWQTEFLLVGAIMGVTLESARFVKQRWDLSDEDFSRIWTFCVLLVLAAAVYAFAENDGPANFGKLFSGGTGFNEKQSANSSSIRTATSLLRWLPMIMFLFVVAQVFSTRETIPLHRISIFLPLVRRRKAKKIVGVETTPRNLNASYPYFILCLFSASIHPNNGNQTFFLGEFALLAWALWPQRSQRFNWLIWAGVLLTAVALGFFGQKGLWQLERLAENYSPQWAERFTQHRTDPLQNVTSLGRIGRLKLSGKIVIRLEPKDGSSPPVYLREASYRNYHSQIWRTGTARDDFTGVPAERDGITWVLLPDKTNVLAAYIACYLYGGKALLPLPNGSGRLENLNAFVLQKNSLGAIFAEGPGLVLFDALYGPGATIDSPPDDDADLFVPTNEIPALKQVIAEMNLPEDQREIKTLQAVNSFFADKFQYSLWQGSDKLARTNETVLSRFLLHSRSGHCEYFATATVLLLRELGIPARYAVGYAVHETSGNGYVVRERDAHAWCLFWNKNSHTWQDFDTTPASWVREEQQRASVFEQVSDAWSWLWFQFSKFRWGQSHYREYILWLLIPVLILLLYQIIFRRHKKKQRHKAAAINDVLIRAGLDSEFYQLEKKLAERGVARQPSESFSDWLSRALSDSALADLRAPLRDLLRLHYRHRFDPPGLTAEERATLKREVKNCLNALTKTRADTERPHLTGATN